MYFSFYLDNKDFTGELHYIRDEHSFLYVPPNTNTGVGILIGQYTELDVIYETNVIVHLSGYCHRNTWIAKEMTIPNSKKGCLVMNCGKPLMKGVSVEYDRTWLTYFDDEKQYVCIGDSSTNKADNCVEFANNVIAVLRGKKLIAIWAKVKQI